MDSFPPPNEEIDYWLERAAQHPHDAEQHLSRAIHICQDHGLRKKRADIHVQKCVLYQGMSNRECDALEEIKHAIELDPTNSHAYLIKGNLQMTLASQGDPHEPSTEECYSDAIESLRTGYKLSSAKDPMNICKAVITAVDKGLQKLLRLHEVLTSETCVDVINAMTCSAEVEWHCQHLEYFVVESEQPGSGIAKTFSCDLSNFNWKKIFVKKDFNEDIMKALLSLGAKISREHLKEIVEFIDDSKMEILHLGFDHYAKPLDKKFLNSLCLKSFKKEKLKFSSYIIEKGGKLRIEDILQKFTPSQISSKPLLCGLVKSSTENLMKFLQICLINWKIEDMNYCKMVIQHGGSKLKLDLSIFIEKLQNGSKTKNTRIMEFIEWLLREKYAHLSGISCKNHPIDFVFSLPENGYKMKLYSLLLQYGSTFQTSTLPDDEKSAILQDVTLTALKSGNQKTVEKCKKQILAGHHQLDITTLFPDFRKDGVRDFITWILGQGVVNFDKIEGQQYLLDAALELPNSNEDKPNILCLLIEQGANIACCSYPKRKHTTFLCIVIDIAVQTNDAKLVELTCKKLFEEIKDLPASEKNNYIIDIRGNTPYHVVMARRDSPITRELCQIFKNYPINPNLKNINNLKPGEKGGKKGSIDKRASDQRYRILQEASDRYQDESHKKPQKKSKPKKKSTSNDDTPASIAVEQADITSTTSHPDPSTDMIISPTVDRMSSLVSDLVKSLKDQETSYFERPVDYKRQTSAPTQKPITLRQQSNDNSEAPDIQELPEATTEVSPVVTSIEINHEHDNGFDDLTWEIECTENVKKFLSNKKVPKLYKKAVINKMKQVASDGISNNHKLHGVLGKDLYEARFSKGGRIIYEIAIQFSPRLTDKSKPGEGQYFYTEVIRIWAIVPDHDNVEREIKKIEVSRSRGQTASKPIPLHTKTNEVKGDNKRYPQYYTCSESDMSLQVFQDMPKFVPAGSTRENEYNVITFYAFDKYFEKSMLDGEDVRRDFPFKEWPKEHDIINMPQGQQSILLLGRSGTGKTTCCLYRMWNQFHQYWSKSWIIEHTDLPILNNQSKIDMEEVLEHYESDDESLDSSSSNSDDTAIEEDQKHGDQEHLHQIFITKNYVLCSQMKKRFYDLAAGSTIASEHTPFEDAEIPSHLAKVPDHAFPLFLTARQFFLLLDNSLNDGKSFFPRDEAGNLKEKILSSDYDHEDPDTLIDLVESDSDTEYYEEFDDDEDDVVVKKRATSKVRLKERQEVTAAYFKEKIWPKISKKVSLKHTKLDPLLVWMEIKSFIKGSQNAVEKEEGFLSQQEYMLLGRKMAKNYADHRDDIYKLFELYTNYIKHQSTEALFDECDLTKSIYSRLNLLEDLPWSIHSIYVDEVQDFTQAELAILLRICRNPNDLFLTGDTAQSIMRGISFRFSELKYLFYCAKEQAKKKTKATKIIVPRVKDLQINFRSHTGVLNLAASIIDVMKKYFPSSFDRLPGDEGMFTGPIPIVLESSNISDLALVMHTNKRESSKKIEFGAHQVIIVQSEEAKENIPDVLKSSIILTVFESKGLEFDDVLLFDFFKDSQVKEEWRVVTQYIKTEENSGLIKPENSISPFGSPRLLKFDESQHKLLNSELKYLYTAITRARCNLWIYDSDEGKRLPVFDYWYKRGLIKVIKVDDVTETDESTLFASTSSSEEWKVQGDYFKKKRLWEPAMKCYQKAQCVQLELEAKAYSLVQKARRQTTKSKETRELYLHAAKNFLECDKMAHSYQSLENAAKCLMNAKKYDSAANLFILLKMNDKAFRCFRKTKNYAVLAEIKEKTGKCNDAIRILLKHGGHDNIIKALECASRHENEVSACYQKEHLAHKHANEISKKIDVNDATQIEQFKQILKYLPASEQVDYLKKVKLFNESLKILLNEMKYVDVYQLCKGQGWFEEGWKLAEQKKNADEKMMFLLFKATKELEECGGFSDATKRLLSRMYGRHTEKEIVCTLIYGMGIHNHTLINIARSFYQQKNPIAYLQALHIATAEVTYDHDEHQWKNIQLNKDESLEIIIKYACRLIKDITGQLEKVQDVGSSYMTYNLETFFGLKKDHSGMYLIPESSYPWTNQLLKNIAGLYLFEKNPDNLLRIEPRVIIKAVCDHLEKFCTNWIIEDNLKIVEVCCKKINTFPYHHDVITNGHLKESYLDKLDKKTHLQAYINILSSLFDAKEFGNQQIPFDILQTVLNVLAPQATCYLQTPTLDVEPKQTNNRPFVPQIILSQQLDAALNKMVKARMNVENEKFNLNEWFELWRVLSVTKFGFNKLHNTLIGKTCEVLHKIQTWPSQALNIPPCYIYLPKMSTYNHFIILWSSVCEQLKCKRVLSACTICVHSILRPIASNVLLWETLSISNLLNIATVQLVHILTMLGIRAIRCRKPGNIYVPHSYFNSTKVFLSMAGASHFFDSSHDCMMRRRQEELPELQKKLTNLMCIILNIFIGRQVFAFNPIKMATTDEKCLENHEAEHCVIFVLTLLGNLGLNPLVSDDDLYHFRHQISESIKHCMKPTIKQAYERFANCATLSGYFGAIRVLLEPSRDTLQHMSIHFDAHHRVTYDTKPAQLMTIYQRRLNPLSEISTKESKAVQIRGFKLRPTAAEFIPSWKKSTQSSESVSQQESLTTDDTEPDDLNTALVQHQENIPEDTTEEEESNDTEQFMTGICIICGCSVKSDNPDHQEEDDSTSTNRSLYKEHCRSERHQNKKIEYEKFNLELNECVLYKQNLEELGKKCYEQYEVSRQDHELKKIMDTIAEVLRGFEAKQLEVRESAEWREGVAFIGEEEGKMRSLIMQAEREIENSRERKSMLDQEEEEEDKKEDEEENAFEEGDWDDENIPDTELNYGESAKKKKRKIKRRRVKET